MLYNGECDKRIRLYLGRALKYRGNSRELAPNETAFIDKLRAIETSNRILITELLTIIRFLERISDNDFYFIKRNLNIVVSSLSKQRKLVTSVRLAFMECCPIVEERTSLRALIRKTIERHNYIVKNVLPWNLELTPLYDYLKMIGEGSFISELRKVFPDVRDLFDVEKTNAYVDKVYKILESNGVADAYKPRLEAYIKLTKQRGELDEREKRELKMEQEAFLKRTAEQAISDFRRIFLRDFNSLNGNSNIGLSAKAVQDVINDTGRKGYIVLVLYLHNNKYICKYASDGKTSPRFLHADIFDTKEEAGNIARRIEDANRKAATFIVGLAETA